MGKLDFRKVRIILSHAFVVWLLCGATMGILPSLIGIGATLIVHAIGAPVYASVVSWIYYRKFNFTSPMVTAVIFTLFIIIVDAALVAPVFVKSFEMFTSFIGTWLPFSLIFIATWMTGLLINRTK